MAHRPVRYGELVVVVGTELSIGFAPTGASVALRADPSHRATLEKLAFRFGGARMRGAAWLEVPLDEFLADLGALALWPYPDDVRWQGELLRLAQSSIDDAAAAGARLGATDSSETTTAPDAVLGLLGLSWRAPLTDFQQRNIARLLSMRHGADFSVPGAGKTREALALFAALRGPGDIARMLVVCPKSAYESWQFESAICFGGNVSVYLVESGRPSAGADILLVNYERLDRAKTRLAEWLKAAPAMLVLDEAHRMKLGSAGVYGSVCMELGPLSTRRLILTGTPAPNGSKDLENLFSFVWPGQGRRIIANAVDGGTLAYASQVLKPLYTRTTKSELGLPPVDVRIRRIALPPLHREIYDALVGRYSARAEASRSDFDALGKAMLRLLMAATSPALLNEGTSRYEPLSYQLPALEIPKADSLYQLLHRLPSYELSPKYGEARQIAAGNAARGRKTLVWSTFVRSLNTLETLLSDLQPAVVHGGTANRDEEIARFRSDPDCKVLISNPATLGEGISLHHVCHDAVYVDRDFQAGRFLQSLDRIHRLGLAQNAETRVTVLVAEGTIDEIVAMRLEQKIAFLAAVLDDPDVQQLADLEEEPSIIGGMDMDDIRALLSHLQRRGAPTAG